MGIRFRCPNGHKIHVKSYLAGKRGICPRCGVKVPIPQQSDPEFTARSQVREPAKSAGKQAPRQEAATGARSAEQPVGATGSAAAQHSGPAEAPTKSRSLTSPKAASTAAPAGAQTDERPASTAGNAGVAAGKSSGGTLASAGRGEPSVASGDVIAAAPHAKWFVRPPSGGQYGPASGSLLREWIAAGRVTADSYVWREGWPEWQRAQAVFGISTSVAPVAEPASATPPVVAQPVPKSALELYRRRQSSRMTLTIVGLLTLACAVLFATLVYVVHYLN